MTPDSHTFTVCSTLRMLVLTYSSHSETVYIHPQSPLLVTPGKIRARELRTKGQNSAFGNWVYQGLPPSPIPTPPVFLCSSIKPLRYPTKKFIVQNVSKQMATYLVCQGQPSWWLSYWWPQQLSNCPRQKYPSLDNKLYSHPNYKPQMDQHRETGRRQHQLTVQ